jgi:hypothetical protein
MTREFGNDASELTLDDLQSVSGGRVTLDLGWAVFSIGVEAGNLIMAATVGSHGGGVFITPPK